MKSPEAEAQLIEAMRRLQVLGESAQKRSGQSQDTKRIRLLLELIKEQVRNESLVSSTRQVR
jgi:hypothetical protein